MHNPHPEAPPELFGAIGEGINAPEEVLNMMFKAIRGFCSIMTYPVEMVLRPHFGSRYFAPVTVILSLMMHNGAWFAAELLAGAHQEFKSMLGLGAMLLLVWVGFLIHSARVWKRMLNVRREKDSELEGPPIPALGFVPTKSWAIIRIIIEPAIVIAVGIVLPLARIVHPYMAIYFAMAGGALMLKNMIFWYQGWLTIRKILDSKFRAKILADMAAGGSMPEKVGPIVVSSIPVDTPHALKVEVLKRANKLAPEFEDILSEKEPPKKAA